MKQLTFPKVTECIHIYPSGFQEKVRYGQYEAIMITKENGWDVSRTITLAVPHYYVEEVTTSDGVTVVFDEPVFLINEREYGDASGRTARKVK
jgi:hypothetical protein